MLRRWVAGRLQRWAKDAVDPAMEVLLDCAAYALRMDTLAAYKADGLLWAARCFGGKRTAPGGSAEAGSD